MYDDDCRLNIKYFIIVVVILMTLNIILSADADKDLVDADTTLFIRAGVYL
jgi:hypothetical protein